MFTAAPADYDVLIVGGGVVGLAVLRAATLQGFRCACLEREDDLLSWASGSNSGIVCTGVDAAPGSLERALIRDSISQIREFCQQMNVPFRPCGSLVLGQWQKEQTVGDSLEDAESRLQEVLAQSHNAGDTHAVRLTLDQVLMMESNLNPSAIVDENGVGGAVHIPGEIVIDPWLYSVALAAQARENGADIFTAFEMDPTVSSFDGKQWTICRKVTDDDNTHSQQLPTSLTARAVVSATGIWADEVQQSVFQDKPCPWKACPRRGQYRIFTAPSLSQSFDGEALSPFLVHPIQPVPTQRTKGVLVFSTLYDQIVVGPTALDQDSKIDRSIDPVVGDELTRIAQFILPRLFQNNDSESYCNGHLVQGEYVGIRPASDKRDYQIHTTWSKRWIACAGIRSTGLTASLGIGRHVVHLLQQIFCTVPIPPIEIKSTPLPPLQEMMTNFHERSDGCVTINSHIYKVTHPLTVLGWTTRASGDAKQE